MRLIDADALIETVKNERFSGWGNCCVEIENAPTVDAVNHGKWLKRNNENYSPFDPCSSENICICNQCGYETDFETNYCANCGAKMDGERKDDEQIR